MIRLKGLIPFGQAAVPWINSETIGQSEATNTTAKMILMARTQLRLPISARRLAPPSAQVVDEQSPAIIKITLNTTRLAQNWPATRYVALSPTAMIHAFGLTIGTLPPAGTSAADSRRRRF